MSSLEVIKAGGYSFWNSFVEGAKKNASRFVVWVKSDPGHIAARTDKLARSTFAVVRSHPQEAFVVAVASVLSVYVVKKLYHYLTT